MTKSKKILIIIVALIIVLFLGFKIVSNKITSDAKALPVEEIDFSQIEDGQYVGKYRIFPVNVSVKTTVQSGKITQIEIVEHFNGKGASAENIVDRIVEKQSLKVDIISGATVSSKTIIKAVEDSLLGAKKGAKHIN